MATQSLRQEFHTELASTFIDDIQLQNSHYYYFLGKTDPWGATDLPGSSPQLNQSQIDFQLRSNALYFKKIAHNDVSLVTKRYNWEENIVYDKWDHTIDMSSKKFYCMTDEFNVYKCLDNNAGSLSTVKPSGQSFSHFKTTDGYTWKFMYNIPVFKRTKFLSLVNMPIQKALSDSFYDRGAIEKVLVTNGGTGYADVQVTYISASNTAVGSGAVLSLTAHPLTGMIQSVSVTNGGTGYIAGAKIKITNSDFGTGAELSPIIVGGIIQQVTIDSPGVGYQTGDIASVIVGQAVLIPNISRVTGEILDVTIIDGGSGYQTTPTLTVSVANGSTPGTGLYGTNPTALVSAIVENGQIVRVLIADPGKDYPTDLDTTITVSGDGVGAVFSPVVYDGEIVSVIVENAGSGYTFIQTQVNGSGTGATLKAITGSSDFNSNQSIVEQTSIRGAIYSIQITNGGTNYSQATTVSIQGDGVGCTASLVIDQGVITNIIIDSPGTGYSFATVIFNDPSRNVAPIGSVDATAYVILPPRRGHGRDAVVELFGNRLSIVSVLKKDHGMEKFNIEQEYRQYGILKNPSYLNSGKTFRAEANLVVYTVQIPSVTGLVEDEVVSSNGVRYRVISYDTTANTVSLQRLTDRNASFDVLVAESDTNRTYSVNAVLSTPLLDKYSGRLLYVSDETPFVIQNEQNILVKTFITL